MPEAIGAIRGRDRAASLGKRYVAAVHRASTRPRPRTPRRRTRRSARPTSRASPTTWRKLPREGSGAPLRADLEARRGEPDGLGRARADDGRDRGQGPRRQGLRPARDRLGRRCSTASSSSTRRAATTACTSTRARTITPRTTRTAAACRRWPRATASRTRASRPSSTSPQPPPRYSEATLVKRMEELGIGRPSTYASTLAVLRGPRLRARSTRSGSSRRTRAAWSSPSWRASSSATSSSTSPPTSRRSSTSSPTASWSGRTCCATSGATSRRAIDEIKDLRVGEVLEALNELLGPHIFPAKGDGSRPAHCPSCSAGPAVAEDLGKFGAFIGCSQLSGLPLHAPVHRRSGDGARRLPRRRQAAGPRSGDGPAGHAAHRPLRPLRAARRRQRATRSRKRASIPKGIDAATIDLEKALQLLSLPREVGTPSRDRQADHGRRSAATARSSCTTAPTPTWRHRGGVHGRPQPRRQPCSPTRRPARAAGRFQRAAANGAEGSGRASRHGGKIEVLTGAMAPT